MVRLITDSAADMDAEEYEKNGITCIPISVSFGDETYQESVNLTKKEFYRLQEQKTEFPKTAQPSPQAYLDAFRKAKDAGDETIFLSMSSRISSAYQSAVLAKNMLNYAACHIIDTCTATGGQRILLEHAALLRNVGVAAKIRWRIYGVEEEYRERPMPSVHLPTSNRFSMLRKTGR